MNNRDNFSEIETDAFTLSNVEIIILNFSVSDT